MSGIEISGGVTDEESAAITAVVAHLLSKEAEMLAAPPPRPQQSAWVRAWQPRPMAVRSATRRSSAMEPESTDDD